MPNYEYECLECDHRFERLQRFSDPPVDACPQCGSAVRRVLHPVGIVFKGSGWYVTDSRSSNTATSTPTEKNEKSDGDAKTTSGEGQSQRRGQIRGQERGQVGSGLVARSRRCGVAAFWPIPRRRQRALNPRRAKWLLMRAIVQRVTAASVTVAGEEAGRIGPGLVLLVGVRHGDSPAAARWLAEKVAHLRIFADEASKFNRSVLDVGGSILLISQFTVYGDCRKGRRPNFIAAAAVGCCRSRWLKRWPRSCVTVGCR